MEERKKSSTAQVTSPTVRACWRQNSFGDSSKCDLIQNLPSTLWTFLSPKPLTFPEPSEKLSFQNSGTMVGIRPGTPEPSDLSRTFRRTFPEPYLKAYPKPFRQAETPFKTHDLQNMFNVPALLERFAMVSLPWLALAKMVIEPIIYISLTQGYGYAELEAEERESSSDCWRSLLFSSWSMCASYSRSTTWATTKPLFLSNILVV